MTHDEHEPPTLPLPPLWRLAVAAAVVVAFLYFIYQSYEPAYEPEPPPRSGLIERIG
jgi:hypothetical protein